jgi:hypothetical protein
VRGGGERARAALGGRLGHEEDEPDEARRDALCHVRGGVHLRPAPRVTGAARRGDFGARRGVAVVSECAFSPVRGAGRGGRVRLVRGEGRGVSD